MRKKFKMANAAICGLLVMSMTACGSSGASGTAESNSEKTVANSQQTAASSTSEEVKTTAQVSGESSAVNGNTQNLEFYMVDPVVGNPYWDNIYSGASAAAEYYGVKLNRVGPTEVNYDEQLKYMSTAIADGCNGIFTAALAPDTFAPVIKESVDKGIPVVLVDSDAPETERTLYAGTSNYAAGYTAGEAMAEAIGKKGQVAIMVGTIDAQNMIDREQGFKDAVAQYPDIEVVTTEASDSDYTKGIDKANATILAYPDIVGFYGASSTDGPAIATALQEAGKSKGDVKVIAMDDNDDTLQFIRDGWIYGATVQNTYAMGWYGVMYLYEINKGTLPMEKKEGEDIIDTGVVVVTADNIDTYKDEMPVDKVEP